MPETSPDFNPKKIITESHFHLYLAIGILFALIFWKASAIEDAFITFRTVDQFAHGNGLRWNIHERVQAYTNPLWMLLHIPFYYLWEHILFVALFISFVCTAIAICLPFRTYNILNVPKWPVLWAFIIPLILSNNFLKYSTSGLENPLTHALFAWFGYLLFCCHSERRWFWLSIVTALSLFNRLDLVLFYLPIWAILLISEHQFIRWRQLLCGALPIVGWELFSLFYYGFPFPNTKYAKLNTGIDTFEYTRKGAWYVLNLAVADFPSFLWILLSFLGAVFIKFIKTLGDNEPKRYVFGILLAASLYTFYIIMVGGGNHETGRTLTLPIYVSVWLFPLVFRDLQAQRRWQGFWEKVIIGLICLVLLYPVGKFQKQICPPCFEGIFPNYGKIGDRSLRPEYLREKLQGNKSISAATFPYKDIGFAGGIGKYGFKSARETIIIDRVALSDPLLSRLPSINKKLWAVGHSERKIPKGYIYAIRTGDTSKMEPNLAQYYEKLRLITQGDLWSVERLKTILYFNLGAYDYLKTPPIQE